MSSPKIAAPPDTMLTRLSAWTSDGPMLRIDDGSSYVEVAFTPDRVEVAGVRAVLDTTDRMHRYRVERVGAAIHLFVHL